MNKILLSVLFIMLLATPFSAMAGKYETILAWVIEKKVESKREAFISQLEIVLPVAQEKFEKQAMELSGEEKLKVEAKVQLVKDLIIDLALIKDNYISTDEVMTDENSDDMNLQNEEEEEELSSHQGSENSEAHLYNWVFFNTSNAFFPVEALISEGSSSIMYRDKTIDLSSDFTGYMGMNVYYLLIPKEQSYGVDTYEFIISLENDEYLHVEYKQSRNAALGNGPEFHSAILLGQGSEYNELEWYTAESEYIKVIEKLETSF